MISVRRDPDAVGRTAVLEALAHRRRRSVLRRVAAGERVHLEDLVGSLAATGGEPSASPAPPPERLRIELCHRHLPKLVDAGLVRWGDGEVEATPRLREDQLLRDLLAVEVDDWDAVLEALADPIRRLAVATLAEADDGVDVPVLAFRVAEDCGGSGRTDVDELVRELHHVHLPKLADAGLVAVEEAGTAVRYLGHPELDDLSDAADAGERDPLELAN